MGFVSLGLEELFDLAKLATLVQSKVANSQV
jgi:hypothetical protein